jgi:membrane-anchored glycerophosphoryl diester phosphodiesterase (GDPDase)
MNEPGIPAPHSMSTSAPLPSGALTFGQILDRVYRLMRAHLKLFFGIAGVPAAAALLFMAAVASFEVKIFRTVLAGNPISLPVFPPYFIAIFLIGEPLLLLVCALYLPAAIHAAVQADLGATVTFREAYRAAWSRFGRYLWLLILFALYLIVPIVVVVAIATPIALMHFARGTAPISGFPFFLIAIVALLYLCFIVYSILISLRFALAFPACVEENLTARAALRRSAQLTRDAKGRIFLAILVVYAAVYAVQLVCVLVLGVVASLVALGAMMAHVTLGSPAFFVLAGLGVFGYALLIVVITLLIYSALTTALAVLYHDQRRRNQSSTPAPAA